MDVSQLPLREDPPPREAKVAADRVEAVLEPWGKRIQHEANAMQLQPHKDDSSTWMCLTSQWRTKQSTKHHTYLFSAFDVRHYSDKGFAECERGPNWVLKTWRVLSKNELDFLIDLTRFIKQSTEHHAQGFSAFRVTCKHHAIMRFITYDREVRLCTAGLKRYEQTRTSRQHQANEFSTECNSALNVIQKRGLLNMRAVQHIYRGGSIWYYVKKGHR